MQYEISGHLLQTLTLDLTPADSLYSQTHSMAWMSDGVKVSTHTGGGLWEGVKRAFSGSSFFVTEFRAERAARLAFTARYPGTIVPLELKPGEAMLCRRESFLCAQKSVTLELAFHNPDVWLFGQQGLVMQKVVGPGTVFIDLSGELVTQTLGAGEKLYLRPGHVGMLEPTVRFEMNMVEGVSNALFGQGLFMTTLTGPGRVWLQTMPVEHLIDALGLRRQSPVVTTSRSSSTRQREEEPKPAPSPVAPRGLVGRLFEYLFEEGPVLGPGPVKRKLDTVEDRAREMVDRSPGIGFSWGGGSKSSDSDKKDEGGGYGLNF